MYYYFNFAQALKAKVRWAGPKIWTLKWTLLRLRNRKTWPLTAITGDLLWTQETESIMDRLVVQRKRDLEKRLALRPKTVTGHRPHTILHRLLLRIWQLCWQNVPVQI